MVIIKIYNLMLVFEDTFNWE